MPTHREDRPLSRCLDSIAPQLAADDEVIVVGDVHDGPLPAVQQIVEQYGFRYIPHDAGHHCYGHCPLNYAMQFATGDYVHVNDDDDVWAPDAVEVMRTAAQENPGQPLLFRFKSYHGPIFWNTKGALVRNAIGGHCLVTPAERAGMFSCEYTGDFDWVMTSVMNCGGTQTAVWLDKVICYARPKWTYA